MVEGGGSAAILTGDGLRSEQVAPLMKRCGGSRGAGLSVNEVD
jgi:hypothetical protein